MTAPLHVDVFPITSTSGGDATHSTTKINAVDAKIHMFGENLWASFPPHSLPRRAGQGPT